MFHSGKSSTIVEGGKRYVFFQSLKNECEPKELAQTHTQPARVLREHQDDADFVGISVVVDLTTCIVNTCTTSCL